MVAEEAISSSQSSSSSCLAFRCSSSCCSFDALTNTTTTTPKSLTWIFICLGIKVVSTASALPILPFFVTHTLGAGPVELGNSISIFAFTQMLGSLLFGRLSDAFGRRQIMLCSFAWNVIGYILVVRANSINTFYIARAVAGLSGGSIAMTSAMVADVTTSKSRPYYNGLMGAVIGIGFVLGPAIGGISHLLLESRRSCLCLAVGGSFVALLLGMWTIPETLPPHRRRSFLWLGSDRNNNRQTTQQHKKTLKCSGDEDVEVTTFLLQNDQRTTLDNKDNSRENTSTAALPYNQQQQQDTTTTTRTTTTASHNSSSSGTTTSSSGSSGTTTSGSGICYVGLSMICLSRLCLSFSTSVMGVTYYLLLQDSYAFVRPDRELSKILTITGLCVVIYQGCLFRRIANSAGPHGTMIEATRELHMVV
eukprot:GHVS01072742.1.p1 GENE.GHVS01072742.1~~GHVS01072742.1.p1  ORF type:complete len:476 (-),score=124.62 GHVS01072742.1:343-1605(-)